MGENNRPGLVTRLWQQRAQHFKTLCVLGSGLMLACPAHANSIRKVTSTFDGQEPYDIVYTSSDSETDLKPGIYYHVPRAAQVETVALGNVLDVGRGFNGIISQFSMTKTTARYEALAVIDNHLALFSTVSRATQPKSMIVFGQNTPLHDVLTGNRVQLDPITTTSPSAINFFVADQPGSQVLMVSVKQKNINGPGVTFACAVKRGTERVELEAPPVVIDYSFSTAEQLQRLFDSGTQILSPRHLQQIAQPSGNDDQILKSFRAFVAKVAANPSEIGKLEAMSKVLIRANFAPRFDLASSRLTLNSLPIDQVFDTPALKIYQRVDPFGSRSGVFINDLRQHLEAATTPARINGRIDYDEKKHQYRIVDISKSDVKGTTTPQDRSVVLASIENRVYALIAKSVGPAMQVAVDITDAIKPDIFQCSRITGVVSSTLHGQTEADRAIVISCQVESKRSRTVVVKLKELTDWFQVVGYFEINNKFYSVTDMLKRIKVTKVDGEEEPSILFNAVSERLKPVEKSPAGKELDPNDTVPYLNISKSVPGNMQQGYISPTASFELFAGKARFKVFDPVGATVRKTGVYVVPDRNESATDASGEKFVEGRILTKKDIKKPELENPDENKTRLKVQRVARSKVTAAQKADPWADFEPIEINQEFKLDFVDDDEDGYEARASMVPLIPAHMEGKGSFFLTGMFRSSLKDFSSRTVLPKLFKIGIPVDFSRFEGARLIQGRRKASSEFSLLVFVSRKDGASQNHPTRGGAGVMSIPLTIRLARDGQHYVFRNTIDIDRAEWIYSGEMSPAMVKDRVLFDSDGHLMWILTPELQRTDKGFAVRRMVYADEVRKLFPNEGFQEVAVRMDESIEDDWELGFSRRSRWLVERRADLEARVPDFSAYMKDLDKKFEEAQKKNRKPKRDILFPELAEYLESLALATTPKEHTVLLLSQDLLSTVRNQIMGQWIDRSNANSKFSFSNIDFRLHMYDPSFSPKETLENLQRVGRNPNIKDLLYVDLGTLLTREETDKPISLKLVAGADSSVDDEAEEAPNHQRDNPDEAQAEGDHHDESKEPEPAPGHESQPLLSGTLSPAMRELSEKRKRELIYPYTRMAFLALEGENVNLERFRTISQRAPFISTLVLATPDEWRELQDYYPIERKAGVFDSFKVDARFLTGSWTVWPPRSSKVSSEIREFNKTPITKDEYQVFQGLDATLASMATGTTRHKHQILVVPDEIKPLVTKLIMTRWATDSKELEGPWSYQNRNLAVFNINIAQGAVNQEAVVDNYDSMRGALVSRQPVVIADLGELIKIGRPGTKNNEDRVFRLRDPISSGQAGAGIATELEKTTDGEPTVETERSQPPHILWWVATEGRKIQPKKSAGWKLDQDANAAIPTLIVATEKELQAVKLDMSFEERFLNLEEHFNITRLVKPDDQQKLALLEELFRRPEIATLGYSFAHQNLPPKGAQQQLLGLVIGQVERISQDLKIESTVAFLKIYSALKRALTEDVDLRRARQIDSAYLMRLFAKVFPMQLSYAILRPDDKLQRLRDPYTAARKLQELGYEGPMEFKQLAINDLTAHTKGTGGAADSGRQIPSSLVLVGDSSSGKTYFFQKIIELLGLKIYQFSNPFDDEAEAFVLKVQDLTESDDPAHPEKLSIDKALSHLDNFLAKPNGWRGFILIDDLHKAATTTILSKLMTRLQSYFEAEKGMIKVRAMSPQSGQPGVVKEIPVRNLQLGITLNPTTDLEKRRRYFKDFGERAPDPAREAVAALSRKDFEVDPSFFARITAVINMNEFPREAKVPSLLKKVREGNLKDFAVTNRLVLVTPRTLDALVDQFPNSNARDFLDPATYSLLNLAADMPRAPVFIIDPKTENKAVMDRSTLFSDAKVDPNRINDALKLSTIVRPVREDDPISKLHFASFMIDNFRGTILNSLILGAQNSPELTRNFETKTTTMVSFLAAILGSSIRTPRLPLEYTDIRPADFGVVGYDATVDFQAEVSKHPSNENLPKIRITLGSREEEFVDLSSFLGQDTPQIPQRSRMDLLRTTSFEIHELVEKLLARSLHVHQLRDLQDPASWIGSLDESDPKQDFSEAAQELIRMYIRFSARLYDINLTEMRDRSGIMSMQIYDEARLFLLCLDSAISQIRWSYVAEFVLKSITLASDNLALGQKPGLNNLLFKSTFSPLTTVTPESIKTNVQGISVMKPVDRAALSRYHSGFEANCESYLRLGGGQ